MSELSSTEQAVRSISGSKVAVSQHCTRLLYAAMVERGTVTILMEILLKQQMKPEFD
ncbi:hypothetical protein IG631_20369 [Alternaria alternata]|nr:hypothetical protein IG631_20369 [Alternaria alternata]